jgi:hypothetical protein
VPSNCPAVSNVNAPVYCPSVTTGADSLLVGDVTFTYNLGVYQSCLFNITNSAKDGLEIELPAKAGLYVLSSTDATW